MGKRLRLLDKRRTAQKDKTLKDTFTVFQTILRQKNVFNTTTLRDGGFSGLSRVQTNDPPKDVTEYTLVLNRSELAMFHVRVIGKEELQTDFQDQECKQTFEAQKTASRRRPSAVGSL